MSDGSANITPIRPGLYPSAPRSVEAARQDGYQCLSPLERAVGIEFATTGHTLKAIAADISQPITDVRRAFNDPVVRAFIKDLQDEVFAHKAVNAAWVEQQILSIWPQLIGEEPVFAINKSGDEVFARKFHGPEVTSILKHFSGNAEQKKVGGVNVTINFGDMGVDQKAPFIDSVVINGPSDGE